MSNTNYDAFDLKSILAGGLIAEDVLNRVIDSSPVDTPFMSSIGSSSVSNNLFSWTLDRLLAPITGGQIVDGDSTNVDGSRTGTRIWNTSEIRTKSIIVSTRAEAVNTIGFMRSLVYQIQQRGKEMKRNVEATILSNNPGVLGTDIAAGTTAGLVAALTAGVYQPGTGTSFTQGTWTPFTTPYATGSVISAASSANSLGGGSATNIGGYSNTTVPIGGSQPMALARTAVNTAPSALAEADIRAVANQLYVNGANPTMLMSVPEIISRLSAYMFTSSARIATLINSGSDSSGARTAVGSTNEFLTDFGVTLRFSANRQQLTTSYTSTGTTAGAINSTLFIYDPSSIEMGILSPMKSVEQPVTGLQYSQQLQWDYGVRHLDPHGFGGVVDILSTAAVTAT
jgi:hypothetical protein